MKKWIKIILYSLLGILLMGSITFFTWSIYLQTNERGFVVSR